MISDRIATDAEPAATNESVPAQSFARGPRPGLRLSAAAAIAAALVLSGRCVDLEALTPARAADGWSAPARVDPHEDLFSLSCPAEDFCVAQDGGGFGVTYSDGNWSAPTQVDPFSGVAVSCLSRSFCAAADGNGNGLIYDGSAWSAPSLIEPDEIFSSVSCPSSTQCVAVGFHGHAARYSEGSWSFSEVIDRFDFLRAVSCPSAGFCMAVDEEGNALSYNGSSWTAPRQIDANSDLRSVSCASPSFCEAVDGSGHALAFNGTTWSPPHHVSHEDLTSVSCPTSAFCMAAGGVEGYAVAYSGGSWSTPTLIDSHLVPRQGDLDAVSCSSASFCAAVDEWGDAMVYDGSGGVTATGSPTVTGGTPGDRPRRRRKPIVNSRTGEITLEYDLPARGRVEASGTCLSGAHAAYGRTARSIPSPGVYKLHIAPSGKVLALLKQGRR